MVEDDDTLHAVVLTGCGKYFSSGADLRDNQGLKSSKDANFSMREQPAGRFMFSILNFPKLLCAAVNGPAVGIAVPLLMHCDLVFFHPKATLWAPFARLALVPEFCGSITFRATHGLAKANELLLLGTKIAAEAAVQQYGFGSRILPANLALSSFQPHSLADQMCNIVADRLLSLPSGEITTQVFHRLIKNPWKDHLRKVCNNELSIMNERFRSGQVEDAVRRLKIGSRRSKL